MNLIYFTDDAYKLLKKDLNNNKDKYYSDEPWIDEYFAKYGIEEYIKNSSIIVRDISLVYNGDDRKTKNHDDLINTCTLYNAYKDKITPFQASDPNLWTALSHIIYKDYVLKRWKKNDDEISINDRFFSTNGRASLCSYNAISRLWWSGYLTYDESTIENPYHLTEILFSAQEIQKDLFDQSMSMNKTVVKGLLMALQKIQEEIGNAGTDVFRKCCYSYLNHYGVVSVLDTLSVDDIENISYDFMKKEIKQN